MDNKKKQLLAEIGRFLLIGGFATLVDYAFFYLFNLVILSSYKDVITALKNNDMEHLFYYLGQLDQNKIDTFFTTFLNIFDNSQNNTQDSTSTNSNSASRLSATSIVTLSSLAIMVLGFKNVSSEMLTVARYSLWFAWSTEPL